MRTLSLLTLAVVMAVSTGCTKTSEKGGPGATDRTSTETRRSTDSTLPDHNSRLSDNQNRIPADTATTTRNSETFTVSVPSGETNVTQGESEDVTVSINRGSNFDQAVTLRFNPPIGVKLVPAEVKVQPSDSKATIKVQAMNDAKPGVATVEVEGVPQTGKAVKTAMRLDIKAR